MRLSSLPATIIRGGVIEGDVMIGSIPFVPWCCGDDDEAEEEEGEEEKEEEEGT